MTATSSQRLRIALLGCGLMGLPMARRLLAAGHELHIWNRTRSKAEPLAVEGAHVHDSPRLACLHADYVISMLENGKIVGEVLFGMGPDAAIQGMRAGVLVIDMASIQPREARDHAARLSERGIRHLDAPVSGGTAGAAAGSLTFIVGGEEKTLERARPLLEAMGKNIFHVGESGAGQVAKICNNMALGVIMAVTGEAIALGVAHGLDPKVLSQMMAVSTGRSWATEVCNPWPGVLENAPASRGYSGGFGNDLMLKDLGLAAEAALSTRSSIPLGELARNLYSLHSAGGSGRLDFSSIVNLVKRDQD